MTSTHSGALKDIVLATLAEPDCQTFIRQVTDYAIDSDNQFDDGWVAEVAACRIFGDALRWYTDLDDDVQESWKKLKKALIRECKEQSRSPLSVNSPPSAPPPTSVPTPAAAPISISSATSKDSTTRVGRIRVETSQPQYCGYLSTALSNEGAICVTTDASSALLAEFSTLYEFPSFKILNSSRENVSLAIHWSKAPTYSDHSYSWGRLAILSSGQPAGSSWGTGTGPVVDAPFLVLQTSTILIAGPTTAGGHPMGHLLDTYMRQETREIGYSVSYSQLVAVNSRRGFSNNLCRVKFVFETV